jgi:site-specific recombinase XerD
MNNTQELQKSVEMVNYWNESINAGFMSWIEKHGYSDKSKKTYKSMLLAFLRFIAVKDVPAKLREDREKQITQLSDLDDVNGLSKLIESANKTLTDLFFDIRKVQDRTKVRYLWLISDIYEDMVEAGYIKINNIALIHEKRRAGNRGKTTKRLPVALTKSEVGMFLDYTEQLPKHYSGQREKCALLLLIGTGLREQELCDLKTANMHLNEETPFIKIIGKNDKERLIPIPESLVSTLIDFNNMKTKQSKYFLSSKESGLPYQPSAIYHMVHTAMKDAGIQKEQMSPHVLRHTYCTRQLESGIKIEVVKYWMGHESIATTAIYEHVATTINSAKPVI